MNKESTDRIDLTGGIVGGNGVAREGDVDLPVTEYSAPTGLAVVASRYQSISLTEISTIPKGRCFASPKIDGELWFVEMRDGKATLFARGGRQIGDAPVVTELSAVAARTKSPVIIAGELFAKDGNPRPRVGDVASALASGKHERLHFHAFDVVAAGNSPPPVAYEDRLSMLRQLLSDGESIGVV